MSRRSLTLLIASIGTAVAIAVSVLVPVPYVILGPGPTLNTLGKDSSGKPLITITGRAQYPVSGHLNMVTVSYQGCQGDRFNIFTALVAWLNPHQAVVPESEICPAGQTQKETQQQDTQQMTSSQQTATAAALTELHIPYSTQVVVVQADKGLPAYTAIGPAIDKSMAYSIARTESHFNMRVVSTAKAVGLMQNFSAPPATTAPSLRRANRK